MKSFSLLLSPSLGHFGPKTPRAPFSFLGLAQPPPPLLLVADGWGPPVRTSPYLQPHPRLPRSLSVGNLPGRKPRPRSPTTPLSPPRSGRSGQSARQSTLPFPFPLLASALIRELAVNRRRNLREKPPSRAVSSILVALVSFSLFPAPSPSSCRAFGGPLAPSRARRSNPPPPAVVRHLGRVPGLSEAGIEFPLPSSLSQ